MARSIDTNLDADRRSEIEQFVHGKNAPDYLLVLAHDFESLQARALVHRHVYADDGPEQEAYREFAATTTSRINGCVFCASVHARHVARLLGDRTMIQGFLDRALEADLPPVFEAIARAAAKLTSDPANFGPDDIQELRDLGSSDLQILDILNYAAFFGNANRLMLSLGEPAAMPKLR